MMAALRERATNGDSSWGSLFYHRSFYTDLIYWHLYVLPTSLSQNKTMFKKSKKIQNLAEEKDQ